LTLIFSYLSHTLPSENMQMDWYLLHRILCKWTHDPLFPRHLWKHCYGVQCSHDSPNFACRSINRHCRSPQGGRKAGESDLLRTKKFLSLSL
jgi:hypothetical protein